MNNDQVSPSSFHESRNPQIFSNCFIFSPPVLHPSLSFSSWCHNHCMLYVLALNRSVRIKMLCDVIFHTSDHFLVCCLYIPTFECLALYASSIFCSLCSSHRPRPYVCVRGDYEERDGGSGKYSRDICSAIFLLVRSCFLSLRRCIAMSNKRESIIVSCMCVPVNSCFLS
jgi:hypothetical protein